MLKMAIACQNKIMVVGRPVGTYNNLLKYYVQPFNIDATIQIVPFLPM